MRTITNTSHSPNIASLLRLPDKEKFEIAQQLLISINITALIHEKEKEKKKKKELVFPKVPKNLKVSQEVLDMVVGPLPDGLNWEEETEKMWEELAR